WWEEFSLEVSIEKGATVVNGERVLGRGPVVDPGQMPRAIDHHQVLGCRRLLVGALTSLQRRSDCGIARATQIHDRRIDLIERMLNREGGGIWRERKDRLDSRIFPVRPSAGQFQDRVPTKRMTDQPDMLPIEWGRAKTWVSL